MFTLKTALTKLQNTQQLEDDETLSVQCVLTLQVKVDAFIAHPTTDRYQLVLSSVGAEQGLSAWQDTIVTPDELLVLLKLSPLRPVWQLGTVDVVRLDEPYEQDHTPAQQGDTNMNLLRLFTDPPRDTEKREVLPR